MKNIKLEDVVELDEWFQKEAHTSYELGKTVEIGHDYIVLIGLTESSVKPKFSTLDLRGNIITLESHVYY